MVIMTNYHTAANYQIKQNGDESLTPYGRHYFLYYFIDEDGNGNGN